MYGYFYDGSGYAPPLWNTRSQMFKALLEKSPWLSAWDRLMRLVVRCVCACVYVRVRVCVCTCVYVCTCMGMYVCTCVGVSMYVPVGCR